MKKKLVTSIFSFPITFSKASFIKVIKWIDRFVFNALFNIVAISTLFQLYCSCQGTYPCFPGVLFTSAHTVFFPCHWLLSHTTIVQTKDSGERGMNPITMTIINPRKKYWPSQYHCHKCNLCVVEGYLPFVGFTDNFDTCHQEKKIQIQVKKL